MYPWLWFWAPRFHFPFSGSVAQQIEPDTRRFCAGELQASDPVQLAQVLSRFPQGTPLLTHRPGREA